MALFYPFNPIKISSYFLHMSQHMKMFIDINVIFCHIKMVLLPCWKAPVCCDETADVGLLCQHFIPL